MGAPLAPSGPSLLVLLRCTLGTLAVTLELGDDRGPPRVTSRIDKQQLGRAGDTLRLFCPAHATPPPLYEWLKDGHVVHGGWERHRARQDQLTIRDLELDDTGVYQCRATNGFGSVELTYLVYVSPDANNSLVAPPADFDENVFQELYGKGEAPTFTRPDQMRERHVTLAHGAAHTLRCKAAGRPRPDLVWFKDGKMLSDEVLQGGAEGPEGGEGGEGGPGGGASRWALRLIDVRPGDSGLYTCRAANKAGVVNYTYHVDVRDVPKRSEPPLIGGSGGDDAHPRRPPGSPLQPEAPLSSSPHAALTLGAVVTCTLLLTLTLVLLTYCHLKRAGGGRGGLRAGGSPPSSSRHCCALLIAPRSTQEQRPRLQGALAPPSPPEHSYAVLERCSGPRGGGLRDGFGSFHSTASRGDGSVTEKCAAGDRSTLTRGERLLVVERGGGLGGCYRELVIDRHETKQDSKEGSCSTQEPRYFSPDARLVGLAAAGKCLTVSSTDGHPLMGTEPRHKLCPLGQLEQCHGGMGQRGHNSHHRCWVGRAPGTMGTELSPGGSDMCPSSFVPCHVCHSRPTSLGTMDRAVDVYEGSSSGESGGGARSDRGGARSDRRGEGCAGHQYERC